MSDIVYMPGDEWGMRWDRPPIAQDMPVDEAYVHHTAGGYIADPVLAFRHLNEMAIREGMRAGDYTLLVHRNRDTGIVTVGELRGEWMPAATKYRNGVSKAVCLMGYFHPGHRLSRHPHPDELEGIAWGLHHCIEVGWVKPSAIIRGHRDNPQQDTGTVCPGDYLYPHMPTIRNRVAEMLAPEPPPPIEEDDDMPKRYLARLDTNKYHYRRGDGLHAEVLRSNELHALMQRFDLGVYPGPVTVRYFNPHTDEPITTWAAIPNLTETQLDLDVGYLSRHSQTDEG